jgi:tetratricopeptide (TPR) repeat protein
VARGFALFAHGRLDDAYKVIADALTLAPNREETLAEAVRVALARGRFDQAEEYCQRLLGINPHFAGHHRNLAFARANRHAWPEALRAAQTAVRLDPFRAEARAILITALLETGDRARAESEFGDLGVIDPDYQRKIRPWFEQRLRQAK